MACADSAIRRARAVRRWPADHRHGYPWPGCRALSPADRAAPAGACARGGNHLALAACRRSRNRHCTPPPCPARGSRSRVAEGAGCGSGRALRHGRRIDCRPAALAGGASGAGQRARARLPAAQVRRPPSPGCRRQCCPAAGGRGWNWWHLVAGPSGASASRQGHRDQGFRARSVRRRQSRPGPGRGSAGLGPAEQRRRACTQRIRQATAAAWRDAWHDRARAARTRSPR